jgi:hypothetical protein
LKKGKNYLLFSVLILSLVSIIFLTGGEEVTIEKNEPVFSGESANIVSLTFRLGDREIRIKKVGTWVMEGDVESTVNETLIDDILDNLMAMEKGSTITSISSVDPGEFGLEDHFLNITLRFMKRPAESLIIGDTHPNGQTYYAVMKGHEEIFLVGSVYPKLINISLRKLVKETKDSSTKNSAKKNSATKNSATKNSATKNSATKNNDDTA